MRSLGLTHLAHQPSLTFLFRAPQTLGLSHRPLGPLSILPDRFNTYFPIETS